LAPRSSTSKSVIELVLELNQDLVPTRTVTVRLALMGMRYRPSNMRGRS